MDNSWDRKVYRCLPIAWRDAFSPVGKHMEHGSLCHIIMASSDA